MGATTKIEWTRGSDGSPGSTWNPVTGCTELSPGCDHCYAKTLAERFRGVPGHYFERGFDVQLRPHKLDQPLRWTKPRRIFVNSMSDLFHEKIPRAYIVRVFATMGLAHWHTFQLLTKRHGRMRSLLSDPRFEDEVRIQMLALGERPEPAVRHSGQMPPATDTPSRAPWPWPHLWVGVSAENQALANRRIPDLLRTPAAVRFVSIEPMLGPVDLTKVTWARQGGITLDVLRGNLSAPTMWPGPSKRIDWVIVGGESGRGARPMPAAWARTVRDQCEAAGTPFLFKQWGEYRGYSAVMTEPDLYVNLETGQALPDEAVPDRGIWSGVWRVGKGKAGRVLDGQSHDASPAVSS